MIKGVQNRTEQWSRQLLSVPPNRLSSILTGIPCAAPKVGSVSYHTDVEKNMDQLLPALVCVRGARAYSQAAKASGIQEFGRRFFLFPALKCVSSSIRHKTVPLSMKASDTEARTVQSLVFQDPDILQLHFSDHCRCHR